jgi:hypothetical protein
MEMVKLVLACALLPAAACAAGFSLTVGPPVAAGTGTKVTKTKGASFALRLEECDALDTAQVSGTAEGIVGGERRSAALVIAAAGSPGVYVVSEAWDQTAQGVWVVKISATCRKATAGAIVPMGAQGFVREGVKVLPRVATNAEVDSALKALEAVAR